jgi:serine/threonine protein kinase
MNLISGDCHFKFPIPFAALAKSLPLGSLSIRSAGINNRCSRETSILPYATKEISRIEKQSSCALRAVLCSLHLQISGPMISTWKMYSHPHSLRKLKLNLIKERPNQDQIDGHILLGHGISGYVIALDGNYVQKIFPSSGNPFMDEAKEKDRAIEIRIYKRLGDHLRVYKYIQDVKSGITLERLGKNLRIHLQDLLQDGKPVGLHQAIEWSCQTAQGLAYIHSRKILHTDIGCHNLLLDQHNNLKLCDFAGSSIDGEDPTVCCDVRYQPYTDDPTYPVIIRTEIFALGSTLYEIWTGRKALSR